MIKLQGTRKGRNAPEPHACPRRSLPSRRKINDLVNQDQRSCEGREVPLLEFLAFGSHFIGNFSFLGTSPLLTLRHLSVLFRHHEDIIPRHHAYITLEDITKTSPSSSPRHHAEDITELCHRVLHRRHHRRDTSRACKVPHAESAPSAAPE
jgi:hypothetical protein